MNHFRARSVPNLILRKHKNLIPNSYVRFPHPSWDFYLRSSYLKCSSISFTHSKCIVWPQGKTVTSFIVSNRNCKCVFMSLWESTHFCKTSVLANRFLRLRFQLPRSKLDNCGALLFPHSDGNPESHLNSSTLQPITVKLCSVGKKTKPSRLCLDHNLWREKDKIMKSCSSFCFPLFPCKTHFTNPWCKRSLICDCRNRKLAWLTTLVAVEEILLASSSAKATTGKNIHKMDANDWKGQNIESSRQLFHLAKKKKSSCRILNLSKRYYLVRISVQFFISRNNVKMRIFFKNIFINQT